MIKFLFFTFTFTFTFTFFSQSCVHDHKFQQKKKNEVIDNFSLDYKYDPEAGNNSHIFQDPSRFNTELGGHRHWGDEDRSYYGP